MKQDVIKYFWLAVQIGENGKYHAYAMRVSSSDNLVSKLKRISIVSANICGSKKDAAAIVEAWNHGFQEAGCYMFPSIRRETAEQKGENDL